MSLKDLTRRVRRSLALTQEQFAQKLEATSGSIRNWESGRKRPAPDFLKKMAELAPGFGHEINAHLKAYEWHPRKGVGSRYSEETRQQLISAQDAILDNADSTVVEDIAERLTKAAGWHGGPPDHPGLHAVGAKDKKKKSPSHA